MNCLSSQQPQKEEETGGSKIRMGKLGKKKTVTQGTTSTTGEPSTTTSISAITGETGPNEVDIYLILLNFLG